MAGDRGGSTFRDFLGSDAPYVLPAPGGQISVDIYTEAADLFLAEMAAFIKRKGYTNLEATEVLYRKVGQIALQNHYGAEMDTKIIERLGTWIREISA